ncbi:hypothetical protein E2C01_099067 [Portunus trituberculatus]|uniref:Uncharacterized protein n=1 Tax=Portunus trituberculatus TaxID=210409 RepID=A0A5B7KEG3_PORTR|nr:hypothetical protein [Portunus trituberculatus]
MRGFASYLRLASVDEANTCQIFNNFQPFLYSPAVFRGVQAAYDHGDVWGGPPAYLGHSEHLQGLGKHGERRRKRWRELGKDLEELWKQT